ncbi:MAG: putative metallocarboxypeptidase ecm14 [Alyxoria varia]|nr:MAG: putative metallocarboxypeptidase ecm14 [Alyxoria varia]
MQGFELTIGRNPFQMPTDEFFQDYRPLSVMTPWMQLLQSLYPTHLQLLNIGYSFENREILAFRIGAKSIGHEPHATSRKTILITGGTHAREWIGVSTANFIAHALISNYGNDNDITTLLESIDVVVIPTINPDGYDYTWKTDRLWRKNRQTTPLPFCRGIDLDRSFGFMWGDFASRANSNNPCSENYAGEEAFEGVEAQRIADWVQEEMDEKNTTFVGYMDLHSYSQQILVPFAFSCYDDPPNFEDLEETGEGLAKAIRRIHLRNYAVDRACESNVIGVAMDATLREGPQLDLESGGGSPLDWMYRFGIKNAFQIKLRDTGSYGFLLPKEHIVPTGEEILNAFMYLGNTVKSSISGQNRSDKT